MKYDGVIFDFDGVILASDRNNFEWVTEARREKAQELGYDNESRL